MYLKGVFLIENLKYLRESAGYKQNEISSKLGITQGAVSQWEKGLCKPNYKYLPDLAKIYDCTVDDIIKAINQTDISPNTA